jgi:hypothetical protein
LSVLTPIPLTIKGKLKDGGVGTTPRLVFFPGRVEIFFTGWQTMPASEYTLIYGQYLTPYRKKGLQFEVRKNGRIWQERMNIPGTPPKASLPVNLFSGALTVNDHLEIIFFPKAMDTIIFNLEIKAESLVPLLEQWGADSQSKAIPSQWNYLVEKAFHQPITTHLKKYEQSIIIHGTRFLHVKFNQPLLDDQAVYEYKVVEEKDAGLKGSWVTKRTSQFSIPMEMDPGRYHMWVRYQGMHEYAIIPFTLLPPWYATQGFRMLMVVVFLMFSLMAFFYFYRRKLRIAFRYQTDLSTRMLAMQALITPHMMRNALTALQDLLIQGRWGQASRFADALGSLLHRSYKGQRELYHCLEDECEMIMAFTEVQQLRQSFALTIALPENKGWQHWQIPAGLLQPVVENALKYNLADVMDGCLVIAATVAKDDVILTVSASGKSSKTNLQKPEGGTGFGLQWVEERLVLHNRMYPEAKISLHTELSPTCSQVTFHCKNMSIWTY